MYLAIDLTHEEGPYRRGVRYGELAQAQIEHAVQTYARIFSYCGIDWAAACQLAATYQPILEQMDPDLVPELVGIASGCGRTLNEILALNCRSEILPCDYRFRRERTIKALQQGAENQRDRQALEAIAANERAGIGTWLDDGNECTTFAVSGQASRDGDTWLAQNWDTIGRLRRTLVLLSFVHRDGLTVTTLTEGGMLAKIGFNNAGLAIGLSILRTAEDGKQVGVPTHPLLRCLHTCRSVAQVRETMDRFASIGFASSSNVPCADASGEVASMEYTPQGWAEWRSRDGVVAHTNHFLCAEHIPLQIEQSKSPSTLLRQQVAENILRQDAPDFDTMQACLFDRSQQANSICRYPNTEIPAEGRVETVASVIINVSKAQWWIASNPPEEKKFIYCGTLRNEAVGKESVDG